MPLKLIKPDQRARLKPCLRCGYSLRNNIDARNCPECGLAVRVSLRDGDALDWSNPAWLRRTAWATALIAVAHLGLLASLAVAIVADAIPVDLDDFTSGQMPLPFQLVAAAQIALAASMLLAAAGAARLAAYEGRHPDVLRFGRVALRTTAVALGGLSAWELAQSADWVRYVSIPSWVYGTAASAVAFSVSWYLHEVMRRVPSRRVMDWIWVTSLLVILADLYMLVSPSRDWVLLSVFSGPWEHRVWPLTVAALVYLPLATLLTTLCWRRLRSAARDADKHWVPNA